MSNWRLFDWELLNRWNDSTYDKLRQVVLVFKGSTEKELPVEKYDASILKQKGESVSSIRGMLYLTTQRIVFLPENAFPHEDLAMAVYTSLRSLTGVKNDMTIALSDNNGGSAVFKFYNDNNLFVCFNLLRTICLAARQSENVFLGTIKDILNGKKRDSTPFSSIDFELSETTNKLDIDTNASKVVTDVVNEGVDDDILELLSPIKTFLDYCNNLNFDIHIKLRVLFVVSLISFLLKFIPLLPLLSLVCVAALSYFAFANLKQTHTGHDADELKLSDSRGHSVEGYTRTRQFFREWFMWKNPRKSMLLLQCSLAVFILWIILPTWLYIILCTAGYVFIVAKPMTSATLIKELATGFWFCT